MGRRKEYMPRQDSKFFHFQRNLATKVEAKKAAWGIPDEAVEVLANHRAVYEPLYHKIKSRATRTPVDVAAHRIERQAYEKDIRAFVNAHIRHNGKMTDVERAGVGVPPPDREPSPKPRIDDIPWVELSPLGGAWIRVTCRRKSDQDKPSMHKYADVIECRYILLPKGQKPPRSVKEFPNVQMSKRAMFIIKCGDENAGLFFYGCFRWVNLSNPENNGSWTAALREVVS
ncbi:MAG: hypothetical protein AB1599_01350 [Planctomycetota bacterium]